MRSSRTQHYHVLASLADDGEAAQAPLADRIAFDRSDLVTVLDELEKLAYVVRRTDSADRLLEPLTPGERKTLLALLGRLVRGVSTGLPALTKGVLQPTALVG